jgi:predicted transcriptional regulator
MDLILRQIRSTHRSSWLIAWVFRHSVEYLLAYDLTRSQTLGERVAPGPTLAAWRRWLCRRVRPGSKPLRSSDVARLCYNSFAKENTMTTTTIRLPEELKARIARAAERVGTTAHNFILLAIAEKADEEERKADFHDTADTRYANLIASGRTVPWSDMRAYLEARLAGKTRARPRPKKLPR